MRFSRCGRLLSVMVGLLGALATPSLALAHGFAHAHEGHAPASGLATSGTAVVSAESDSHQHAAIGAQIERRALDPTVVPFAVAAPVERAHTAVSRPRVKWRVEDSSGGVCDGTPRLTTGPPPIR